MLVVVGVKEDSLGREVEISVDTDDLSDEEYARFRELWDSGDVAEAKRFLMK